MKRVQANLTNGHVAQLAELQEATGDGPARVMRDALEVYSWHLEQHRSGRQVRAVGKRGEPHRILTLHFE